MPKKLYVGNIPWSSTQEDIKALFEKYGEVSNVTIINDRVTGRPRGFCFVEMENAEDAASNLDQTEFSGRVIKVNEARDRQRA